MQEVDIAALDRDQQHAERERNEIEAGEACVLAQHRGARHEPGGERHRQPRREPAEAHGEQRQPGEHIADGRAGQNGVAHGVAHQAHAPEHEEHADRRRRQRDGEAADQRPAHEGELDEGLNHAVDHAGSCSSSSSRSQTWACSSNASVSWRDLVRLAGVRTLRVSPQATTSRASSSVRGKCARTCSMS